MGVEGERRDEGASEEEHSLFQMDFTSYVSVDDNVMDDSFRIETGDDMDDKCVEISFGGEAHAPDENEFSAHGGGEDASVHGISYENERVELPIHDGGEDPYIGMRFESEQAAMVYYDAYAKRVGFVLRVGNCHRSGRDNSIISRRFLCNKEGFRLSNGKSKRNENRKPRETTREGCNAMIMVRREKSGKWVISKLEKEHCHPLGLPASKGRRGSVQARPQDEKDKKIRELTMELHRANQRLAECREQLNTILNDAERHTDRLSKTVNEIVKNVKEIEAEDQEEPSNRFTV